MSSPGNTVLPAVGAEVVPFLLDDVLKAGSEFLQDVLEGRHHAVRLRDFVSGRSGPVVAAGAARDYDELIGAQADRDATVMEEPRMAARHGPCDGAGPLPLTPAALRDGLNLDLLTGEGH